MELHWNLEMEMEMYICLFYAFTKEVVEWILF